MSATGQPAPIQVGAAPGVERLILRFGLLALFAGVTVYFAVSEPAFRSVDNIISILQSVSTVGIIALGVTVSTGRRRLRPLDRRQRRAYGDAVRDRARAFAWPTVAVVPIALAAGLLIGALNGLLIVRLKVPDLLATLGMLFVLQGLQLLPSRGQSISTGVRARREGVHGDLHRRVPLHRAGQAVRRDPVPDVILRSWRSCCGWCSTARAGVASSTRGATRGGEARGDRRGPVRAAAYLVSGGLAALGGSSWRAVGAAT